MGIVIGIDVGDVRVGIALSDPEGRYAVPHGVVLRADSVAEREILRLITALKVDTVVSGLPLGKDGTSNKQCLKVENFCRRLKKRAKIRIVYVDEYLSSEEAKERLRSSGKKKLNPGDIDAVAASIILQGYLDGNGRLG